MFQNNLRIAFRNLLKNKTQSTILISGLTIGMAACMLLLQYVNFELSYDAFHSKKDKIFRVVNERFQNGASVQKGTVTYPTIGPTMMDEFREIQNATRLAFSSDIMVTKGDKIDPIEPALWADEHFFEIFDFKLLASEGLTTLSNPNELILTREIADRYFPAAKGNYTQVIGQELEIDRYPDPFKIVGVCENIPANSSINFKILGSYATCIRYWGAGADNSWTWSDFYHYLEIKEGTDIAALEAKFPNFSERHFKGTEISGSEEVFSLQALKDAHLYSKDLEYEIGQTANGKAVWSLLIIAFFILIIAWINYINLSSVIAIERAKEVGVRKVMGATKGQLIRQFLAEALAINTFSLVFALGLVQIISPWLATNLAVDAASLSFLGGQFQFLDEAYNRMYSSELLIGKLANFFAFIAIFISMLGLFGLISFMADQRTKEIGIRKVLGASVLSIIGLLSRDLIKLVSIAFLIAAPIAYYFAQDWLQNFEYHIEMSWGIFALAGLGTILIALGTMSVQSIRAAVANPIEALKNQ